MTISLSASRRLLVIIPALNEQASLGRVVTRVRAACPEADVVVINDGSGDDTARGRARIDAPRIQAR